MKQSLSLASFSFQKKRGEVVSLILIFIHIILIAVFFHSDIWYFDNFKLIICLHCNHSLILQIDYFSVPGKVIIVLLFNHNHRLISFETLHCCCHHHQPGLRILTFSCNFLKSASGIDVRDQFVHPFPYIKSISRKGFIGLVWSERLLLLRKAAFQTAHVAWLFPTADWLELLTD